MEKIKNLLLNAKWIYAKSMPKFPHEYTLRKNWDNDDFIKCVLFIRKNGYIKHFYKIKYTYYNIENKCYWTMGNPIDKTLLINRALLKINIKQIDEKDIDKKAGEKAGLIFCKSTIYFGIFDDDCMVGYAGVILYKNKIIDKNIYIYPQYRGRGYFKYFLDWRKNFAKEKNIKKIEATCTKMSINEYLKRGFETKEKYKNCTKVIHENIF